MEDPYGETEEKIIIEDVPATQQMEIIKAKEKSGKDDNDTPIDVGSAPVSTTQSSTPKRGRSKRVPKAPARFEDEKILTFSQRGSRRSAARAILPIDDEQANYFPCPVEKCFVVEKTRTERNLHLKTDHPGYVYQEGDGEDKKRVQTQKIKKEKKDSKPFGTTRMAPSSEKAILSSLLSAELTAVHTPSPAVATSSKAVSNVNNSSTWENEAELEEEHFSELDDDDVDFHIPQFMQKKKAVKRERKLTREREMEEGETPSFMKIRKRGRPKNPPGAEPAANSKIRVRDPNGKYACYLPHCDWRGGYRSIRADHMRWCHKDWKLPPRYILQRASREGVYLDADSYEPEFSCGVTGCDWKGNYRASRSAHMRAAHPEYQPLRRKAPAGGFLPDGKYECHVPSCGWRGASRSTRAAHMKKHHPGYVNPIYTQRSLPCCDCNVNCPSHKVFVDHMVTEHRIGGLVQREFTDVRDYEEWFDAVQESFSVEFVKRMGIKQTELYQVLYLYCARSGGYRPKRMRTSHPYIADCIKKRLNPRSLSKCGKNCAAFLRVVHWTDGRLTVVGCVEHTGHRLGTSLLRLSPAEREVLDEYLYVQEDDTPLEFMLDRLRDVEGFAVDGYDVIPRTAEDLAAHVVDQTNELNSLNGLITNPNIFPPDSIFNVNLTDSQGVDGGAEGLTLGLMTESMKDLWRKYSSRATCIEEVRLMISSWDVSLMFVLVFDHTDTPRCACVYISQNADRTPLLKHLREVHDGAIDTLVTDCSPEWPVLIEQHFGEATYNSDIQIADWHLLPEWANQIDQLVHNKVDKFSLLCILRRWIRASEPTLFEGMVIDMFEALREMELDELAQTLDAQLTDPEYAKRWTPLNRNPLTEHSNPTLEIASRMFRERFLNCEQCSRLDEYVGLLYDRISEFNNCVTSGLYATAPIEPPRQVPPMYEDIDPGHVMADGTLVQHCHVDEDAVGLEECLVESGLKRAKLEVFDDVVREEEVVEEDGIVMQHQLAGQLTQSQDLMGAPPALDRYDSNQPVSGSIVAKTETDEDRKARIEHMMQTLKDRMNNLSDEQSMHLMEQSLSQVVEQLDSQSINNQSMPSINSPMTSSSRSIDTHPMSMTSSSTHLTHNQSMPMTSATHHSINNQSMTMTSSSHPIDSQSMSMTSSINTQSISMPTASLMGLHHVQDEEEVMEEEELIEDEMSPERDA